MDVQVRFNGRGQVTVFIIIAILLVSATGLFLLLRNNESPITGDAPAQNPESFLDSCLKENIEDAVYEIGRQGGFTEHNAYISQFLFTDEEEPMDIEYLCYQNQDYLPCINQEPMLFHHLAGEIGDYIGADVSNCWLALTQKLSDEGYVVDAKKEGYSVALKEDYIEVPIYGTIVLTKSGQVTREEDFQARIPSKLYYLIKTAQRIVSNEALAGKFNYVNYMMVYPDISISLHTRGDGDKIYTIKHRETGEMFRFAVRGFINGPGY